MISKEDLKWAFQLKTEGGCDATCEDIETLIHQMLCTMEELETAKRCLPVDKEFEVRGSWIGSVQNYIVHLEESLEVMDSEPVAYIFKHPAGRLFWSLTDESNKGHDDVMPVYASPQPVPVVPDLQRLKEIYSIFCTPTTGSDNALSAIHNAMLNGGKL